MWAQKRTTTHLYERRIATQPLAIVYDERSGNLIVAMGIQGVLVGNPDGRWTPYTVGAYTPTDFSFSRQNASAADGWCLMGCFFGPLPVDDRG